MRHIQTFILRLLVDPDAPQALRGAVGSVPENEPRPFADEQALLAELRRLVRESLESASQHISHREGGLSDES